MALGAKAGACRPAGCRHRHKSTVRVKVGWVQGLRGAPGGALDRGQASTSCLTGVKSYPGQAMVTLVLMNVANGPLPSSDEILLLLLREGATIWPVVRST